MKKKLFITLPLVISMLTGVVIFFNSCSQLPEDKYKSCRFSGKCYSIDEKDKNKAIDECKAIAKAHNRNSYFVLIEVSPKSCN